MMLDERACPRCAETIKADAKVCKHCQAEFSPEDVKAAATSAAVKQGAVGFGCLGLLAIVLLPLAMCSPEDAGSNDTSPANEVAAVATIDPQAAKAELSTLIATVDAQGKSCDQDTRSVVEAVQDASRGRRTVFEAYAVAQGAEESCEEAWLAIDDVEPSKALSDAVGPSLKKTLDDCSAVYMIRRDAMRTLMKALDGDARPSVIVEFQKQAGAAEAGILVCAGGLVSAREKLGGDTPKGETAPAA